VSAVVPDTSIWITLIREGKAEDFVRRGVRAGSVRLASVVAEELYAGAAGPSDKEDLDRIRVAFASAGLTLTPTFDDWCSAGTMMARYAHLHGRIDPRDHVNDVLIVLSAAQIGGILLTWNIEDFQRWNRMLPTSRRVRVQTPAGG
jgi:predicted nucleic acid-binding protein